MQCQLSHLCGKTVTCVSPSSGDDDDGLSPGAIAGVVIAVVVGVGLFAAVGVFMFMRMKQAQPAKTETKGEAEMAKNPASDVA